MTADPASREPLKPCPFCGGDKVYVQNGDISKPEGGWWTLIWCSSCGGRGDERATEAEAEAIAAWNRRHPPAPEGVSVKALEWIENGPSKRYADTPSGRYELTNHMAFEWHAHFNGKAVGDGPWRSEAKAIAAAQADYEQRIRSALSAAPAVSPDGAQDELNRLNSMIDERIRHYEALIDKGQGTHGQSDYVTDAIWHAWCGRLGAYRSMAAPAAPAAQEGVSDACDHKHWNFKEHGRRCTCGELMAGWGD